jgi:hypothetical protein
LATAIQSGVSCRISMARFQGMGWDGMHDRHRPHAAESCRSRARRMAVDRHFFEFYDQPRQGGVCVPRDLCGARARL